MGIVSNTSHLWLYRITLLKKPIRVLFFVTFGLEETGVHWYIRSVATWQSPGSKVFDCGYPSHTLVHHLRFRCSPRMCHALFMSTSLYFEDQVLKDGGMQTEAARCPYCRSSEKFGAMKVLENSRQICENCGHIVFPDDKAFLCPCQKCLASRFRTIA